jgi:predicted DNA binding CopG/RHH family protein
MKQKTILTKEEQDIERAVLKGEYVPVSSFLSEKKKLEAAAEYTLEKTRTISIRMTEKNLMKIKAVAAREGLPYQTLITSILHKHV